MATCIDIIDSRSIAHSSAVQVALQSEPSHLSYPSILTGDSFYQHPQPLSHPQQQTQGYPLANLHLQQPPQQQLPQDYYSYGNPQQPSLQQLQQPPRHPLNNNYHNFGNLNKGKVSKKTSVASLPYSNNNNTNCPTPQRRMGRKKIQITRIQDERNRQVSFGSYS